MLLKYKEVPKENSFDNALLGKPIHKVQPGHTDI